MSKLETMEDDNELCHEKMKPRIEYLQSDPYEFESNLRSRNCTKEVDRCYVLPDRWIEFFMTALIRAKWKEYLVLLFKTLKCKRIGNKTLHANSNQL